MYIHIQVDQIFIHVIFVIMSTLLLLNLIIAMMGDTYGRERQKEGMPGIVGFLCSYLRSVLP